MSHSIRGLCLSLLAVAACAPVPRVGYRLRPGGMTVEGSSIRFVVVLQAAARTVDDRVFVVTCPTEGLAIEDDQCRWQEAGSPSGAGRPAPASLRLRRARRAARLPPFPRRAVRATAADDHTCALDEVQVRSDGSRDGVEGYWLEVCGRQRFYQWSQQMGRFTDRTPAE